jgi:hypothetical protein
MDIEPTHEVVDARDGATITFGTRDECQNWVKTFGNAMFMVLSIQSATDYRMEINAYRTDGGNPSARHCPANDPCSDCAAG